MKLRGHTKASGFLSVSGGHKIHWEDWGNPKAKLPIIYLHGGPGSGFHDRQKLFFNPYHHRVIFFDQRGAGKSTPLGSIKDNTTQDLISDIESLRAHHKLTTFSIMGGSWGSTLALAYAIKYPQHVKKMLLWGIFLGRKKDIRYLSQGGGKSHFPDAWERYVSMVPAHEQDHTDKHYFKEFSHRDIAVRNKYVREWQLYEASLASLDSQPDKIELSLSQEEEMEESYAAAKIEAFYMVNNCFLSENYILKHASKIAHIPSVLVQGRYDFVCPPTGAFELTQALGDNAHLHIVPAGHSSSDTVSREVIKAYCASFLDEQH